MSDRFPIEEFEVMSDMVKMFTEPVLEADTELLAQIWEREELAKRDRAQSLNIDRAELRSDAKFQTLLEEVGVEIEYKDGKNGLIPCFAKGDQFMKDLQDDVDPHVRALAEARIGESSTLMQTRAERMAWMATRGKLCVYLNYAGAGTLRPSGGDKMNWLNLRRNSDLRKAIMAPDGYLLGPCDASQIEVRVAAVLAGEERLLRMFREGQDPYIDIASEFYGEKIYKPKKGDPREVEMSTKRGAGKQAILMCLGARTEVLTSNGIKPILQVTLDDLLWDGVEWVSHKGLINQGKKETIEIAGCWMTPDHRVLCGPMWLEARHLQNANMLSRALASASASLPFQATSWASKAGLKTSWSVVLANVPNMRLIRTICFWDAARTAENVRINYKDRDLKITMRTRIFARMMHTVADCWSAFRRYTIDASRVPNTMLTPTTAVAGFKSAPSGKMIGERFSRTSSRCPVGTTQSFQLTASTIKAVMCRAICVLQRLTRKQRIDEDFGTLSKKSPTYDIACAGPRNRFTVVTNVGFLIVHNCQYGAAAKRYRATAKAGTYGPPIDMSLEEAERHVNIYRQTYPAICARPDRQHLGGRQTHPDYPEGGYWSQCSRMLARIAGGDPVQWGPFLVKNKRLYHPGGAPMIYDTLEFYKPQPHEDVKDFERRGYWRVRTRSGYKTMHGPKLLQNQCESVSRLIVTQAQIRCARMGYRALNHPYDELLFLIPDDGHAEEHLERCRLEMCKTPTWLPGITLDADASLGKRYSK